MSLNEWQKFGWVTTHPVHYDEIRALLAVAERDLRDCEVSGLSSDTQLWLACNAALQLATAVLAASGYRASKEGRYLRTIESLAFTVQMEPTLVRKLDAYRKKRQVSENERAGETSDTEVVEIKGFANDLRQRVNGWLGTHRPDLLKERPVVK